MGTERRGWSTENVRVESFNGIAGVFAARDYEAGEVLLPLTGRSPAEKTRYSIQVGIDCHLDPEAPTDGDTSEAQPGRQDASDAGSDDHAASGAAPDHDAASRASISHDAAPGAGTSHDAASDAVPGQFRTDSSAVAAAPAPWKFLNHSCDPNLQIDLDALCFSALRPIASGEELTFNYLTTEWEMASPFQCLCGSPACYGMIRGFAHLSPSEQERLLPEAAPHIHVLAARVRQAMSNSVAQ